MQFDGQVIATFGRHLLVRDAVGTEWRARPFGRRVAVVCGDEVRCEIDVRHSEAYVIEVHPRRSCLSRSSVRGATEPIVANVSLLLVALAPVPEPDFFVVDRYLCAAASACIAAALVVNKSELGASDAVRAELAAYADAGYRWIECSARAGTGIGGLVELCAGSVSALVGQSGVGKSSLVAALIPAADVRTGELVREEEGRHTTTASRLYDLPNSGHLIDSPGVRDYAPAPEQLEPVSLGFVEVARLAPECRFGDCRHLREPDCAVRAAAESGAMHPRRYESYRRLRRLYDSLREARGPKRRP
jgi:ribosome biogenesis GTPase / thiamine phosphate phosphatase